MKRTVLLLFCAVLLLVGCAAPSVSNDSGEAPLPLTWWIVRGEDSSYYPSYDENPAARYFETMTFNGRKIDLHFLVPLSGAELDNFNTLLATEDYAMIMDMQHSTTSAAELYEDGIIYDLTPYIDEYMPNYKRVLEEHAEESQFLYSNVNGEQKILTVCLVKNEYVGNFMGLLYRRDWVAN